VRNVDIPLEDLVVNNVTVGKRLQGNVEPRNAYSSIEEATADIGWTSNGFLR